MSKISKVELPDFLKYSGLAEKFANVIPLDSKKHDPRPYLKYSVSKNQYGNNNESDIELSDSSDDDDFINTNNVINDTKSIKYDITLEIKNDQEFVQILEILRYWMVKYIPKKIYHYYYDDTRESHSLEKYLYSEKKCISPYFDPKSKLLKNHTDLFTNQFNLMRRIYNFGYSAIKVVDLIRESNYSGFQTYISGSFLLNHITNGKWFPRDLDIFTNDPKFADRLYQAIAPPTISIKEFAKVVYSHVDENGKENGKFTTTSDKNMVKMLDSYFLDNNIETSKKTEYNRYKKFKYGKGISYKMDSPYNLKKENNYSSVYEIIAKEYQFSNKIISVTNIESQNVYFNNSPMPIGKKLQIILCEGDIAKYINEFDFDCVKNYFDGKTITITPAAKKSIDSMTVTLPDTYNNIFDLSKTIERTNRYSKYIRIGKKKINRGFLFKYPNEFRLKTSISTSVAKTTRARIFGENRPNLRTRDVFTLGRNIFNNNCLNKSFKLIDNYTVSITDSAAVEYSSDEDEY